MSCATVSFSVPGKPQPKERARIPKNGKGGYTPTKTKTYERSVAISRAMTPDETQDAK